jgi:hypothetical protein
MALQFSNGTENVYHIYIPQLIGHHILIAYCGSSLVLA